MKNSVRAHYEFHQAVLNDDLVFMFGTGISSALTGEKYSWWKWIEDGITLLKNKGIADSLKTALEADGSTPNMIRVVGDVLKASKADGTYGKWMHESFEEIV